MVLRVLCHINCDGIVVLIFPKRGGGIFDDDVMFKQCLNPLLVHNNGRMVTGRDETFQLLCHRRLVRGRCLDGDIAERVIGRHTYVIGEHLDSLYFI